MFTFFDFFLSLIISPALNENNKIVSVYSDWCKLLETWYDLSILLLIFYSL